MTELTDRQREILTFLCTQFARRLRVPTLREICEYFNLRSTNGVADHLRALEKKGFITVDALLSRGIVILKDQDGKRPVVEFRFGQ